MINTLPVLMDLSWVPTTNTPSVPQKADQPAQATETIKCPLTGEEIPACCCPVQK